MIGTLIQQRTLLAGCVLISGCTVCHNAMRTMVHEPTAYSWKHDRRRSVQAYRQWAEQAWMDESRLWPETQFGPDYRLGFRDGFVDYAYSGGTGEAPSVPPRRCYWNAVLRSPDGKHRAEQWFAGYRHGALVAYEGGYRDLGRVQSSLFGPTRGAPPASFHEAVDRPTLDEEWDSLDTEPLPEPGRAEPAPPPRSPSNDRPLPENESAKRGGFSRATRMRSVRRG